MAKEIFSVKKKKNEKLIKFNEKDMNIIMKKELIISIIIIFVIVIGDKLMDKYTDESFDVISEKLSVLKENMDSTNDEKKRMMSEINKEWDKRFDILTCFLEHDELEKIKTGLVNTSSGLEVYDDKYVYEELNKTIYIINHIKNKEACRVDNIF